MWRIYADPQLRAGRLLQIVLCCFVFLAYKVLPIIVSFSFRWLPTHQNWTRTELKEHRLEHVCRELRCFHTVMYSKLAVSPNIICPPSKEFSEQSCRRMQNESHWSARSRCFHVFAKWIFNTPKLNWQPKWWKGSMNRLTVKVRLLKSAQSYGREVAITLCVSIKLQSCDW